MKVAKEDKKSSEEKKGLMLYIRHNDVSTADAAGVEGELG
jgi:hypothetical protein